jgi:hypothetical protein
MWTVDYRSDGLDQHNYKSLKTILIVHFKSDSYNTKQRQTVEKETLENLFALKQDCLNPKQKPEHNNSKATSIPAKNEKKNKNKNTRTNQTGRPKQKHGRKPLQYQKLHHTNRKNMINS